MVHQPGRARVARAWFEDRPGIVSGVLDRAYQRHPLTRLRRDPLHQQCLGTALQVMLQCDPARTVRVAYGAPLTRADLATGGSDAAALTRGVIRAAEQLVLRPPDDWRVVVAREPAMTLELAGVAELG